jgi:hypothetical protein
MWVAIGHRHALVDDGAIVIGLGAVNSIEVVARHRRRDGAAPGRLVQDESPALPASQYGPSSADRKSRWGAALTTWAFWRAILRAEELLLPTTPGGSRPCERLGQTGISCQARPQEHCLTQTDCPTLTERSENGRPATRAEKDAGRQRCIRGGDRDAPDVVGAQGCLDRADLCRLWLATARTVLCQLTRRRTF